MPTKLQIISGKYKGKKLVIPDSGARPTQQRARSAVFNILNSIFLDKVSDPFPKSITVWDAFAGSGAMGIEFISRFGATSAIFTDTNLTAIKTIKENSKNIIDYKIIIKQIDALKFPIPSAPDAAAGFLVIFVDPPYSTPELGQKLINRLGEASEVSSGTIVVWEFDKSATSIGPQINPSQFLIIKDKTYGRARFVILKKI